MTVLFSGDLCSATQIDLFDSCERKWAFRYIAGIKDPAGPPLLLGTEVDDEQLQPYLREGRPFDFSKPPIADGYTASGYIAQSAVSFLPAPKSPGMEVQKRFVLPSPTWASGGLSYEGGVDLFAADGSVFPETAFDPKQRTSTLPVVCDFKTAGSWRWILTAPESDPLSGTLASNVQAMLYATWGMYVTGYRTIDLVWLYMATKGAKKTKRVHLRIQADHVAEQFERINEVAARIKKARQTITDPLELEPNPEVCSKFNGCPHQSKCNLSPSQQFAAAEARHNSRSKVLPMDSATNILLANLKKQNGAAPTAPLAPAPVQVAPPVAGPSAIELLQAQIAALQASAAQPAPAPAMAPTPPGPVTPYYAPPATDAEKAAASARARELVSAPVGINPPESALPPAPPVGTVATPPPPAETAAPAAEARKPVGRPRKNAQTATPGDEADRHQRIGALVIELAQLLGVAS